MTGINQVVWHPATNTLHAESDQLLAQHTRYLLVVTDSVRDAAGDRIEAALEARTTLFRNDLVKAAIPAVRSNPHTFLTNLFDAGAPFAVQAQTQIATFIATGGAVTLDPDGASPFFEAPMVGPPPEDLAYLP